MKWSVQVAIERYATARSVSNIPRHDPQHLNKQLQNILNILINMLPLLRIQKKERERDIHIIFSLINEASIFSLINETSIFNLINETYFI